MNASIHANKPSERQQINDVFIIIRKILDAILPTLMTSQTLQNRTAFQALGHGRQGVPLTHPPDDGLGTEREVLGD